MALHEIGKLKIRLGKEGFGVKIGERKLFSFGAKNGAAGTDDYAEYPDDSDYAYDDQNAYYPDEEAGYDEYDNGANGYGDEYYDDNQGEYYQQDGGYYPDDDRPQAGRVMEYIENNPWVVYALLVALPPLGIYLLWRQGRFEFPIRMGVSVVSAIWFVIALILIISGIVGGGSDPSKLPAMTLTTMAPSQAPTATPTVAPTVTVSATEELLTPSATPLGGAIGGAPSVTQGADTELTNVYSPQTGLYYHKIDTCSNIDVGAQVTLVTVEAAKNRNQSPCPLCCGGTVYYATADGKWYHTDRSCQSMTGAVEYSKEAAEKEGKTACPVCAGGKETTNKGDGKTKAQKYAESITTDKSGVEVYMTANGKWFHTNKTCQGMSEPRKVSLLKALQAGKTGCPKCFASANKLVYCTPRGTWYHLDKNCKNMLDASQVTLAAAAVLGKKQCPDCVTDDFFNNNNGNGGDGGDDGGEAPDNGDEPDGKIEKPKGDGSTVYVYATPTGRYYHTNSACTDMKNAEKVTLLSMLNEGRPACPECCSTASKTVYVSKNGKYYHSYATCNGMTDARQGTLAQALAYGYKVCGDCWSGNNPVDDGDKNGDGGAPDDGNDGYSDFYVYASENGKYYHTRKSCSKADSDVSKVLLELAIDDGKTACPSCASEADDTVYATKNGKYYHKTKDHAGSGAAAGTMAKAIIRGYKPCSECYKESGDDGSKKYTPGKSGINVYANASGKYYHTVKSCSAASGTVVKVTLEAALNNNKTACTVCAASARRTVYANKDGKYYHYSSSCAGSSASNGTLDAALAMGFKACPNCVTGDNDDDKDKNKNKYEPGKSGIKVYATTSGKYFHQKKNCGSMKDGTKITLEDALNYGLEACPNCAASAAKKVYAVEGAGTYHYDASCAGKRAQAGTMAQALALGMKACPKCVEKGGDDPGLPEDPDNPDKTKPPVDDDDRSAPGDTNVYIDLSGNTSAYLYHKKAKCAECGMTNGTAVTLKYALDQGFSDCGHCKPPLSIAK